MKSRGKGTYEITGRETVAEGTDLRVQVLTLDAGQCVPWHHHSEITDSFVGLVGETVIETRAPETVVRLAPGERYMVPPGTSHTVRGDGGPCGFLIVQGVGTYDFIPDD